MKIDKYYPMDVFRDLLNNNLCEFNFTNDNVEKIKQLLISSNIAEISKQLAVHLHFTDQYNGVKVVICDK